MSQPKLSSFSSYIPDFLWISENSQSIEPAFIEIEPPSKKWFNTNGDFTAHFTHALGQFENWSVWIKEPKNQLNFISFFGLEEICKKKSFVPYFLLIYGRRNEVMENPNWNKKRHERKRIISK
ncbi:DUF4263 domain-containing protein [Methanospirillum sp. J.3.6.1-F.2.7.3]|uniref:DUF4263 domain-containing protein n=1 Tax=Methanospirillum purgamenti TaxID=2834276 RepID=A0A8E7B018_9EURY|nr:DUF4263 domain-containing protein [Methanospirillum sp. J.3.6.1-F.2.7.3]